MYNNVRSTSFLVDSRYYNSPSIILVSHSLMNLLMLLKNPKFAGKKKFIHFGFNHFISSTGTLFGDGHVSVF